ncbi:unnamed protein product [Nezara viridula]|uniref:Uncharacterized protein n=1 Tax=Nezara viridula TaxID=85310 RepID=A0A9P0MPY5_NEZVI|nr:unnamed protein product [Nezara viridula]
MFGKGQPFNLTLQRWLALNLADRQGPTRQSSQSERHLHTEADSAINAAAPRGIDNGYICIGYSGGNEWVRAIATIVLSLALSFYLSPLSASPLLLPA